MTVFFRSDSEQDYTPQSVRYILLLEPASEPKQCVQAEREIPATLIIHSMLHLSGITVHKIAYASLKRFLETRARIDRVSIVQTQMLWRCKFGPSNHRNRQVLYLCDARFWWIEVACVHYLHTKQNLVPNKQDHCRCALIGRLRRSSRYSATHSGTADRRSTAWR